MRILSSSSLPKHLQSIGCALQHLGVAFGFTLIFAETPLTKPCKFVWNHTSKLVTYVSTNPNLFNILPVQVDHL